MIFFLSLLFIFSEIVCMENPSHLKPAQKEFLVISDSQGENDYLIDKKTYDEYWPQLLKIHTNTSDPLVQKAYHILLELGSGVPCKMQPEIASLLTFYKFPLDQAAYNDDLCGVIGLFNKINDPQLTKINDTNQFSGSTSTIDWSQFDRKNNSDPANNSKQSQ